MSTTSGDSRNWHISTRSGGGGCVEVALETPTVVVRDSKDRSGPQLAFPVRQWQGFIAAVQHGTFD